MSLIDIKNIGGLISGIGDTAVKIRTAITGVDVNKQAELLKLSAEIESKLMTAQIELNKEEAKSTNLFKSGWRPFIGWTCAGAFFFQFILQPLLLFFFNLFKLNIRLNILDLTVMLPVLLGMLGIGSFRTFEKYKGLEK